MMAMHLTLMTACVTSRMRSSSSSTVRSHVGSITLSSTPVGMAGHSTAAMGVRVWVWCRGNGCRGVHRACDRPPLDHQVPRPQSLGASA